MKYPISEIFTSPQGEGIYTGFMMTFIRLSGCSVGKPYPKDMYKAKSGPSDPECEVHNYHMGDGKCSCATKLPIYTEQCTLYDGRTFACDTDYRVHARLDIDHILVQIPKDIKHVVITGGEPLIHDLNPLLLALVNSGRVVHLETSGTKLLKVDPEVKLHLWITVSPKFPLLDAMVVMADEIKLLVDKDFSWDTVPDSIKKHKRVYIQPVNGEFHVDKANLQLCMDIQKANPQVILSLQLHKILSDYVGETVR